VRNALRRFREKEAKINRPINSFQGKYRFLSNFWPCDVLYEGVTYLAVETAFQAAKSMDLTIRQQFGHLPPGEAKRRGRRIELRPDWEDVKLEIMGPTWSAPSFRIWSYEPCYWRRATVTWKKPRSGAIAFGVFPKAWTTTILVKY